MGYLPSLWTVTQALGGVLVIGIVSTAGLLYKFQTTLIYPASFPAGSRTEVLTPDHFDLPYEDVRLTTSDGETLRAYFIPQRIISDRERARGESAAEDDVTRRRPTVLFLHANAGNIGHRLPIAQVFHRRFGCNVFMLSYRGYGLSTGNPTEKGIRLDAQTALEWIKAHRLLGETKVIAYGQSIGGAVSVDLASKNPDSIHALVLENTFLSIRKLIPHLMPLAIPFASFCTEYWASEDSIKRIDQEMPVLFLSGRKDELVPPWHMDKLFERCSSRQKVWKGFDEGTHNDTCVKPGYFEAIASFLSAHIIPQLIGSNPTSPDGFTTALPSTGSSGSLAGAGGAGTHQHPVRLRRSASTSSAGSSGSHRRRELRNGRVSPSSPSLGQQGRVLAADGSSRRRTSEEEAEESEWVEIGERGSSLGHGGAGGDGGSSNGGSALPSPVQTQAELGRVSPSGSARRLGRSPGRATVADAAAAATGIRDAASASSSTTTRRNVGGAGHEEL